MKKEIPILEAVLKHLPYMQTNKEWYGGIRCPVCNSSEATFSAALNTFKCFQCGTLKNLKGYDSLDKLHENFIKNIGIMNKLIVNIESIPEAKLVALVNFLAENDIEYSEVLLGTHEEDRKGNKDE